MSTREPSRASTPGTISRLARALSQNSVPRPSRSSSFDASPQSKSPTLQRFLTILNVKHNKNANSNFNQDFPPSHWFVDGNVEPRVSVSETDETEVAAAANVPLPPTPAIETETSTLTPDAEHNEAMDEGVQLTTATGTETPKEKPPEPASLARKIRELMTSMFPEQSSSSPPQTPPSDTEPATHTDAASDAPAPPPINDSKFVKLLSSASVMNGSIASGRQSVWSILDSLKSPWVHHESAPNGGPAADNAGRANGKAKEREEDTMSIISDDGSSMMLYGPIIPSPYSDSTVELARSEVLSFAEDESIAPARDVAEEAGKDALSGWWRFQWLWTAAQSHSEKKQVERKVWVPSRTKLSLQVMWWGYRIYLPPPVLQILNSQSLAAAKRAAMFSAALKWVCDHIPVAALPIQLRPAAVLVQRLLPYVGYIGGFVAWSWSGIKGFDRGDGVMLTATWLLPIALIPSTWEPDAPRPPTPPPKTSNGDPVPSAS